jgi:hypothetical protein
LVVIIDVNFLLKIDIYDGKIQYSNMKRSNMLFIVALAAIVIIFAIGFFVCGSSGSPSGQIPDGLKCVTDSDCFPAACCHAESCMNEAYKTPCNELCTQVCSGPLDCGAGHCGCFDGKCSVVAGPGQN